MSTLPMGVGNIVFFAKWTIIQKEFQIKFTDQLRAPLAAAIKKRKLKSSEEDFEEEQVTVKIIKRFCRNLQTRVMQEIAP